MTAWRRHFGQLVVVAIGSACSPETGEQRADPPALRADQMAAQCITLEANDQSPSLCIVDLAGLIVEMEVPPSSGGRPAISPDRRRLAVIEVGGPLRILRVDGTVEHDVELSDTSVAIDWFPTMNALAVLRIEGTVAAVDVVDLDTAAPSAREVFRESVGEEIDPMISVHPNGESVVLAVVGTATSEFRRAELSAKPSTIIKQFDGIAHWPVWSSTGDRIAYAHQIPRDKPSSIAILDVATGDLEIIVPAEQGRSTPTWSPDGTALAFLDGRGALMTVDVATGVQRAVVDLTATQAGRLPAKPTWS